MDTVTRILLVDDHDVVRKGFLSLINSDPTLSVAYEAASVLSAIEIIKSHHIDLVITDLSLPDGSGLDVLNNLNELSPPPKTIVVSIYDSPPYVSESMKHGANGYLSKRTAADDSRGRKKATFKRSSR
jgi:DNA-binding NarL/FixJ family response regulator